MAYSRLTSLQRSRPIYRDPDPSLATVKEAARAAVTALKSRSLKSCLVGGLACYLYGNSRTPGDVDLVVLDATWKQEDLKRLLTTVDTRFYTVASKNPYASYRVLWYRPRDFSTPCKVDLLQPGIMNIPSIPSNKVTNVDGLPCASLPLVLLLKLQAWEDHQNASKAYLRMKQHTDVSDIDRILPIAKERAGTNFKDECVGWMPETFTVLAKARVKTYVKRFPDSRNAWRALGFSTTTRPSIPATSQDRTRRLTAGTEIADLTAALWAVRLQR